MNNNQLKSTTDITGGSSAVYWVCPYQLMRSGLQLNDMRRNNAHSMCPERKRNTLEANQAEYDSLLRKIEKEGFSEKYPIQIFLNRLNGQDKILQGHHRLSIALDLKLDLVPVKFCY
jgi:hypothetical protein